MSAKLTLTIDNAPPQSLPLGSLFTIGRGPGNDLVVNDSRASRNHAAIRLQEKTYFLLDLGSSNGTMVNGRRVMIPLALKPGDEVVVANHRLVFHQDASDSKTDESFSTDDMRTQVELTSVTVSILVVDIRNYTSLTESIPDVDLSRIIGKWFQEANIVIEKNGGMIHKFIGDAIMACWHKDHTPTDRKHVLGPIKAAIDLLHLSKLFHQQLSSTFPTHSFQIGCGINTGKALSGKVGSSDFIGDCVNVAFRLESLCKELNKSIVLSEEVKIATEKDFQFEDLGLQKVKGKAQDLQVYSVKF